MNSKQLQRYFGHRLKQLAIVGRLQPDEVTEMVEDAIELGLDDFWYARKWKFRHEQKTLTISSEQDAYELPNDVVATAGAREQASLDGGAFHFMGKTEFDARFPSPSADPSGYPQVYTAYTEKKILYFKFHPRPSVATVYYDALLDTPDSLEAIPSVASAALTATIGKYIYRVGSSQYREAVQVAADEILKLEVEQSPFAGEQFKFLDRTDVPTRTRRPWM